MVNPPPFAQAPPQHLGRMGKKSSFGLRRLLDAQGKPLPGMYIDPNTLREFQKTKGTFSDVYQQIGGSLQHKKIKMGPCMALGALVVGMLKFL